MRQHRSQFPIIGDGTSMTGPPMSICVLVQKLARSSRGKINSHFVESSQLSAPKRPRLIVIHMRTARCENRHRGKKIVGKATAQPKRGARALLTALLSGNMSFGYEDAIIVAGLLVTGLAGLSVYLSN